MITDTFILFGRLLLQGLNFLLPASSGLPAGFATSLQDFFTKAWAFNDIFPIDTLLQVLVAVVAFEIGVFTFKLFRWIFASVPFSSIKHK